MGDPAGIGLDILVTAWAERASLDLPPLVVVGDAAAIAARMQALGRVADIAPLRTDEVAGWDRWGERLPVIASNARVPVVANRPDPANAGAVIGAIEQAVALVHAGAASAVVTNPIAKDVLAAAGFPHPGHTEFLGELAMRNWGSVATPIMMLASEELRVVPVTVHVALSRVPPLLTRELLLATARITASALADDFGIARPRLALCGLNPHAGEGGLMGREEIEIIAPAIAELRAQGIEASGPYPADTLFHAEARRNYDCVLAMYHDQGLIPLKTLAFDRGVNVTLGLPFVRTSPDHGTAFGIAGSGRASPTSFIEALRLADRLAARRADPRP